MDFFKKFILVRYTILLVAFLLPLVMFVAYSYYQYRLNSITDEQVFRIASINNNTDKPTKYGNTLLKIKIYYIPFFLFLDNFSSCSLCSH